MLKKVRLISLRTRAILYVTLALLPLGVIAIWQTGLIVEDHQASADRALIALTEKAAVRERQIIERGIGGAAALATTAHALENDPTLCRSVLRRFVRSSTLYGHVAFHNADGSFRCASVDLESTPPLSPAMEEIRQKRIIGILRESSDPVLGDAPSLVIATPVFEAAEYRGHLQLHITRGAFRPDADLLNGERPEALVTFNASGELLTSENTDEETRAEMPRNLELAQLVSAEQSAFEATSAGGSERQYVLLPLIPGMAYAMGVWDKSVTLLETEGNYWRTVLIALAMWLASVTTVFFVMNGLVIKGLARLHQQMSTFASRRTIPAGSIEGRGELFEIEQNFRLFAETILQDEAVLENTVREKNVLLKEVHHRVKNNLQLINSIINMVLRGKPSPETRHIVRRLQDRVMALASVHRLIYQAQSMDRVDAAPIVEEIVNQSVKLGLPKDMASNVTLELTPVTLYPDQALPLTLLVSEAITNAIKHAGKDAAHITVVLGLTEAEGEGGQAMCCLSVKNSVAAITEEEVESTSLGSKLMNAFAMQLGGELRTHAQDGVFTLDVEFPVEDFSPEPTDVEFAQKS